MSLYIHHVPGRLRVCTQACRCQPSRVAAAARRLSDLDGIGEIAVNARAGTHRLLRPRQTDTGELLGMLKISIDRFPPGCRVRQQPDHGAVRQGIARCTCADPSSRVRPHPGGRLALSCAAPQAGFCDSVAGPPPRRAPIADLAGISGILYRPHKSRRRDRLLPKGPADPTRQ